MATAMFCRFCLLPCENNYENVERITKELLGVLLLKLDLDRCIKSLLCTNCSKSLQKAFEFKSACLYTEDCIDSFINDEDTAKLDIRKIYLSKNENGNMSIPENHTICRLCMDLTEPDCDISLSGEGKYRISIKIMLAKCLPELNLNTTEDPVTICTFCYESLYEYFSFMNNCLATEKKIKKCYEISGINSGNQITLPGTSKCTTMQILSCRNSYIHMNTIEKKETEFEIEENKILNLKDNRHVKTKNKVDHKNDSYVDIDTVKQFHGGKDSQIELKYETHDLNIKNEEIHIEADGSEFMRSEDTVHTFQREKTKTSMEFSRVNICAYGSEPCVINPSTLSLRDSSKLKTYHCKICDYKTEHSLCFKKHTRMHKDACGLIKYQCEICGFQTTHKNNLNKHKKVHKDPADVTIFQCIICEYKTREKSNINRHMRLHKDSANTGIIYPCQICDYKSKYKASLKTHILIHKDPSQITLYQCEVCKYKTKYKSCLVQHMVIHKDRSGLVVYKCEMCEYKTRHKQYLERHTLVHKTDSNIKMYQCEKCDLTTKYKHQLNKHMLVIHKSESEVQMYQCANCNFQTKYKDHLENHMLTHR